MRKSMHQGADDLTDRERQVCELIAKGRSNKEIACELGVKLATVKAHVEHALGKCQARNRTQLAVEYKRIYRWLVAPY